ncbi:MAG TPA: class I SAM-dependent methyltransferase [Candidatus Saccharicenans sp.]|jgi:ubiquinone/menaquinone biosynthesis C-methylase UbiE|nr:class I SAM-dependent methyltransferase [Candidatus Saccharicenans sp.]HPU93713.1 class I SAM-dependent methyltransferase [Candidatus Saccharicenans sp.]
MEPKNREEGSQVLSKLARRKELQAQYGYDLDRERLAVIEAARPLAGRMLEAGTGRGHLALNLARLGYRLVSFDQSAEQLEFARQNLEAHGLAGLVELRQEDGENLSFADNSFDIIFAVNLVHHLKNPYRVLDELQRVLAPSGKLVISDFNERGLAMMAEIHRLEGDEHEVSGVSLEAVEAYLQAKGMNIKKSSTDFELILVSTWPGKL